MHLCRWEIPSFLLSLIIFMVQKQMLQWYQIKALDPNTKIKTSLLGFTIDETTHPPLTQAFQKLCKDYW